MLHRFLLLLGVLLLAACQATPDPASRLALSAHTPLASTFAQALANSPVAPLHLNSRRAHKTQINEQSPRLLLHNIPSNYLTFSVPLQADEAYSLHVISDCISCSGQARYGLKPLLFLLNERGQVINDQPSDAYSSQQGATLRLTGKAPYDGTFFLIVAADNRDLGREIVLQPSSAPEAQPTHNQRTPMRSYPIGAIRVYANSRS